MPSIGVVNTWTKYSPVMIAQSWGRVTSSVVDDAGHDLGHDDAEERQHQHGPERAPDQLTASARRADGGAVLGDDHRARHDAPHEQQHAGHDEEHETDHHPDLVDQRTEQQRTPGHRADELAEVGMPAPVQVVADHLLGRAASISAMSSSKTSTTQHTDEQLAEIEVVGVDADLVRDPGELDHREPVAKRSLRARQEPDVASPQSGGVPEDGGIAIGSTDNRKILRVDASPRLPLDG